MQFSDSINTDIPKTIEDANSDSSSFLSDTSSSDDESYNTTHPQNPDSSLNDTSSYNTLNKTRDTNPSYTRTRHPTDSSFLSSPNDTSQKNQPKSRTFPTLPYSKDNLKFINKFNFQFSDLTDTEYVTLGNLLVKHKNCYATRKKTMLEKLLLLIEYV